MINESSLAPRSEFRSLLRPGLPGCQRHSHVVTERLLSWHTSILTKWLKKRNIKHCKAMFWSSKWQPSVSASLCWPKFADSCAYFVGFISFTEEGILVGMQSGSYNYKMIYWSSNSVLKYFLNRINISFIYKFSISVYIVSENYNVNQWCKCRYHPERSDDRVWWVHLPVPVTVAEQLLPGRRSVEFYSSTEVSAQVSHNRELSNSKSDVLVTDRINITGKPLSKQL